MKLKLLKATTYLEGNGTIADDLCRNKPEPAASEVTKEAVKRNSHIELLILHKKLASSPRLPKNSSTTVFLETIGSSNNKIQDKGTISNQSFSPFIGRANTATVVLVTKSLLGIVDSSGKEMDVFVSNTPVSGAGGDTEDKQLKDGDGTFRGVVLDHEDHGTEADWKTDELVNGRSAPGMVKQDVDIKKDELEKRISVVDTVLALGYEPSLDLANLGDKVEGGNGGSSMTDLSEKEGREFDVVLEVEDADIKKPSTNPAEVTIMVWKMVVLLKYVAGFSARAVRAEKERKKPEMITTRYALAMSSIVETEANTEFKKDDTVSKKRMTKKKKNITSSKAFKSSSGLFGSSKRTRLACIFAGILLNSTHLVATAEHQNELEPAIINWPVLRSGDATGETQNKITVDGNVAETKVVTYSEPSIAGADPSRKLKGSKGAKSPKVVGTQGAKSPKVVGTQGAKSTRVVGTQGAKSTKVVGTKGAKSTRVVNTKAEERSNKKNISNSPTSDIPTECSDAMDPFTGDPWTLPADNSAVFSSPLVGKTCSDLEAMFPPVEHEKFCKAISQPAIDTKCALEACCFCGGGNLVELSCGDLGIWHLGEEDGNFGCKEIEQASNVTEFCELYKDYISDGMTVRESCCICGGGEKHVAHSSAINGAEEEILSRRRLEDEEIDQVTKNYNVNTWKYTYTTALGESPGIPNLEYLGLGYDFIRGNPRGSSRGELDPGFRYRVRALVQDQSTENLTIDQEFTVPLGTEVRYTSSCKYDSVSEEISTESDYRRSLSKESTFDNSISLQLQGQGWGALAGVAGSLDAKVAWSGSEKLESFKSSSETFNMVTFEAKAVCSEYEVSFNPYSTQDLDPKFAAAVDQLPRTFDSSNAQHRSKFSKFIQAYGTHYVDKVELGAKRILSTSMTSREFAELTKDKVDVASTLSVDVQISIGQPQYINDKLSEDGGSPQIVNNQYNGGGGGEDDIPPAPGGGGTATGGTVETSINRASSSSRQAESASKIAKKKITTSEINVGGLPSGDWREWAASVKQKPMPINYKLVGIWQLLGNKATAFFQALLYLEGIDLSPSDESPLLDLMHFGVSDGNGDPLIPSEMNANVGYRALLQVDEIPKYDPLETGKNSLSEKKSIEFNYDQDYTDKNWEDAVYARQDEYYACGMKGLLDRNYAFVDENGVIEVYLKYCSLKQWQVQSDWESLGSACSAEATEKREKDYGVQTEMMCPPGQFLVGFRGQYLSTNRHRGEVTDEDAGIIGLQGRCNFPGGEEITLKNTNMFCEHHWIDWWEEDACQRTSYWYEWQTIAIDPAIELTENTAAFITGGAIRSGFCAFSADITPQEKVGIVGLKLYWDYAPIPSEEDDGVILAPKEDIVTYAAVWSGKADLPTAIFASSIRGTHVEDFSEQWDLAFDTNGLTDTQKQAFPNFAEVFDNIPFAVSSSRNSAASLAMTDFSGSLSKDSLQSFSFLTVQNDATYFEDIISGVVSYDGTILNSNPAKDFRIKVVKKDGLFELDFRHSSISDFESLTLIVFPNWYTNNGTRFPETMYDVSLTMEPKISFEGMFNVRPGSSSFLGFNFLALSPELDTTTVKHGFIKEHGIASSRLHGLRTPNWVIANSNTTRGDITGRTGFVTIKFDAPFKATPSVIVTPVTDRKPILRSDGSELPLCIVETVTRDKVTVKCQLLKFVKSSALEFYGNETKNETRPVSGKRIGFEHIPFMIVAVGPNGEGCETDSDCLAEWRCDVDKSKCVAEYTDSVFGIAGINIDEESFFVKFYEGEKLPKVFATGKYPMRFLNNFSELYDDVKFSYNCSDDTRQYYLSDDVSIASFPSETYLPDCLERDPQNPKSWGMNFKIEVQWNATVKEELEEKLKKWKDGEGGEQLKSNWWEFQLRIDSIQFLKAGGEACTISSDCESFECASGECV